MNEARRAYAEQRKIAEGQFPLRPKPLLPGRPSTERFCAFVKFYLLHHVSNRCYIPDGVCPHFFVTADLIGTLEKNYNLLPHLHQMERLSLPSGAQRRIKRRCFREYPNLNIAKYVRSRILPFCLSRPHAILREMKKNSKFASIPVYIENFRSVEHAQKIIHQHGTDVSTEILCWLSVYRVKRYLLLLARPEGSDQPIEIPQMMMVEVGGEDYLLANMTKLTTHYFKNVLLPYFAWQFGITYNTEERAALSAWFMQAIENYEPLDSSQGLLERPNEAKRKLPWYKTSCFFEQP